MYEQIKILPEIENFLKKFGFERVVTKWVGSAGWGDAVFIRRDILAKMTHKQLIRMKFYFYLRKFANILKKIKLRKSSSYREESEYSDI
jgi:hypothetical protein